MSRSFVLTRHVLAAALFAGAVTACKDKTTAPPAPASLNAVSDVAVNGTVGENVSLPLTVKVVDAQGSAVGNATVTFSVIEGGGTVTPATATSSSTGIASSVWKLGERSGQQRAQALVAGVTTGVTFTANAAPGAPSVVALSAGDNQTAAAGALVATSPAVVVRDKFANPVPGVSVVFNVIAGNGTVATPGATTNASGVATATGWRLGTVVGVNRLSALIVAAGVSANPIVFTANGTAGAAASVTPVTASTLSALVGTTVTPAPSVRLVDATGNAVAGAQVTFAGSAGSTVGGAVKLTDANGVATVDSWLLGSAAGTYTLTATSGALSAAVFTATARPGTAASVTLFAGNGQSAAVGRPVAVDPAVRVVDGFGNPLAGIEVAFDVTSGGGVAVARRPLTNANGVAEVGGWTLGDVPGNNTLRATVTGNGIANNPIIFSATALAGTPTSLTAIAGTGQSAVAGTAVATPPAVTVRDVRGNPVSGTTVTFLVSTGGGAVTPGTVVTNALGNAAVTSWTLGTAIGAQTLIARVIGLPDVTFTATATAGAPASVSAVTVTDYPQVIVNAFVAPSPAVRVLDAVGNAVSGAQVVFQLDAGSGSAITGATQTTGADGIATLGGWRVGTTAGVLARVRAFVTSLTLTAGTEPQFTATTVAAAAANIVVASTAVQSQAGVASTAVATPPGVRVTDQFGNPVINQTVSFTVLAGNGTVVGGTVSTDANGVATVGSWTMPAGSGVRTLTATLVSSPGLTINFTATVP